MSASSPQLDLLFAGTPDRMPKLSGKQLRDSGMKSVLAHTPDEWKQKLKNRIEGFPKGYRFTIERVVDELGGRPKAVHPNSVGALTAGLAKRGLMKRTGETVKAERASLHCTDCVEWIRS
jgi:hypothetical protein